MKTTEEMGLFFKVPETFIQFLAKIRAYCNIPFIEFSSFSKRISGSVGIPCISYSGIFKRIIAIKPAISFSNGEFDVSIDLVSTSSDQQSKYNLADEAFANAHNRMDFMNFSVIWVRLRIQEPFSSSRNERRKWKLSGES